MPGEGFWAGIAGPKGLVAPTAGPELLFDDEFEVESDIDLASHTPIIGGGYQVPSGRFDILSVSNQARNSEDIERAAHTQDALTVAYTAFVEAIKGDADTARRVGVVVRGNGNDAINTDFTGYFIQVRDGLLRIRRAVNGTGTGLADTAIPDFDPLKLYRYQLTATGDNPVALEAKCIDPDDGSVVAEVTHNDSDADRITTLDRAGIYGRNSDNRFARFWVEAL